MSPASRYAQLKRCFNDDVYGCPAYACNGLLVTSYVAGRTRAVQYGEQRLWDRSMPTNLHEERGGST